MARGVKNFAENFFVDAKIFLCYNHDEGGFNMKIKNISIIVSIIYLIIMAILIFGLGAVTSWLDLFTGFVSGWTVYSLIAHYRYRNRGNRRLQ